MEGRHKSSRKSPDGAEPFVTSPSSLEPSVKATVQRSIASKYSGKECIPVLSIECLVVKLAKHHRKCYLFSLCTHVCAIQSIFLFFF